MKVCVIRTTGVPNFFTTLAQRSHMIVFEKMAEVWYNNKVANILHVVLDYEIILCGFESHGYSSQLSCRCAEVCD